MDFDWKLVLALTVFVMPLAYCTVQVEHLQTQYEIECAQQGGHMNWRNKCSFDSEK